MRVARLLALVAGIAVGAAAFSFVPGDLFEIAIFALVAVAILLGWIAMFQNKAVRYVGMQMWGGLLRPEWRQWIVPTRPSWSVLALLFVVGVVAGGCARVLLLPDA